GSYTRADCARWLAGDPATHNCATAMIADHLGDIALQSYTAGIAGLLALTAYWIMRRRWHDRGTLTALPVGSAEAVGGLSAVLVAVGAVGTGIDPEVVQRGRGAGQQFSLAAAALGAAMFFAIRLYGAVRARRADPVPAVPS